jgi:hypothetical protein
MRVLLGQTDCTLDDVGSLPSDEQARLLDKNSYAHSRPFGGERRGVGSDGLTYLSVRHNGGQCVAVFWPNVVGIPVQERHIQYEWDGQRVTRYFDFKDNAWVSL